MRIEEFVDPVINKTWGELGADIKLSEKKVEVGLGYPTDGFAEELKAELARFLGVEELDVDFRFLRPKQRSFADVSRVIAVASGKGGVGKSTCAVNIAMALEQQGARVGLLDADIYGPSIGMMLGVSPDLKPVVKEEKYFEPIKINGIRTMSMSFLVNENTPMVWRGPMASGALQQMLLQTLWGDVDYLIVDMPPGTGDIQLTLSQKVSVDGAVIVTTPQDIALQDAVKGIEMFRKVDVPILGIIENMSTHVCENCGHESHMFGSGGGSVVAKKWEVPLIAQLPLSLDIREKMDSGDPIVSRNVQHQSAGIFRSAARKISANLWGSKPDLPTISLVSD
jgi:ATP-binding protein involved in chromosome partitioning